MTANKGTILVDQLFPICYNNGMERKKHPRFELSKTNNFGNSKIAKTVDTNIVSCYNNDMLHKRHIFKTLLGNF